MSDEIVYVFANPAMPDYIKIGRTTRDNLEKRRKDLSSPTGVPEPFVCLKAATVADAKKTEKLFHKAFNHFRNNPKREFFKIVPEPVITLLEEFAITDESEAVQKVLDATTSPEEKLTQQAFVAEVNERRSRLKFSDIGILPGAELAFRDDPTKKCRVVNDREIEFEGEITSLYKLATRLLGTTWHNEGALYFTYEDPQHGKELLTDRRDRLENDEEA